MNSAQRFLCSSLFLASALFAGCGGGGGGGGGGAAGGNNPPVDLGNVPATVGLASVAAGAGSVQVRWTAVDALGVTRAIALFSDTSRATLYSGAPAHTAVGGGSLVISGLTNGVERFYGLALDLGGGSYSPCGAVLRAKPGAPLYVDAASSAANPDGLTPATAFASLSTATLAAFANGGGNVWVAGGVYSNVTAQLWPGVHVYGGFDRAAFALATRDPATHVVELRGGAAGAICEILGGDPGAVLDGVSLDGLGVAPFGVDVDASTAELRDLVVENCAGRGMRLRSLRVDVAIDVRLARCKVASNGAEGLSLDGAFDLWVEGSRFASNSSEGLDLDGLLGPDGVPVSLRVRDCAFADNGQDGLDCDLVPPLAPGAGGGDYEVEISGSSFTGNGRAGLASSSSGLYLDIDFELVPGWRADILVRGCRASSNRGDGIRIDADASSDVFVHRVLASSNGGDGLRVTSESTSGLALVSTSVFAGNGGAGLRAALGNVPVAASHCAFAGNAGGGFISSSVTSSAASSVAWMQPTPWSGVVAHFVAAGSDELAPLFADAPIEYRRALSFANSLLVLDDASTLAIGDAVELGDDDVARAIVSFGAGQTARLDPLPSNPNLPASLVRFAAAGDVAEDYQLALGSAALDAGMPFPSGVSVDAGPFGAPLAGEPGRESGALPALFRASSASPSLAAPIAAGSSISVGFAGGTLDTLTVNAQSARARRSTGALINASFTTQSGRLVATPPAGGWPSGQNVLELHSGLESTAGAALASPVALAFTTP